MIFKTIKQRIREKRERKLRLLLVGIYGCCLSEKRLQELDGIYRWLKEQPSKEWKMLARAASKTGAFVTLPEYGKYRPTLGWLRTGDRPADASLPRTEYRNAEKSNKHEVPRRQDVQPCTRG